MTLLDMSIRPASAEALFGSAARGDADSLSDRDVLIVDDNPHTLEARAAELKAEGASVASYTFTKLAALAARGALFIQHLKLEAQVTRDQDGRLARLLMDFAPFTSYSAEIADNAALAALANTMPTGNRGILLAADILYVGVRNHGVLSLAERGIHTYAFDAVTAALEAEGLVNSGATRALGALRFLKCLYRSGESTHGPTALEVVENALSVLPNKFFPNHIRIVDPRSIIREPTPAGAAAYLALRDLERRLIALQALGYDAAVNEELTRLGRWISNPRAYASISRRLSTGIRDTIEQISDHFAPKLSVAAR